MFVFVSWFLNNFHIHIIKQITTKRNAIVQREADVVAAKRQLREVLSERRNNDNKFYFNFVIASLSLS